MMQLYYNLEARDGKNYISRIRCGVFCQKVSSCACLFLATFHLILHLQIFPATDKKATQEQENVQRCPQRDKEEKTKTNKRNVWMPRVNSARDMHHFPGFEVWNEDDVVLEECNLARMRSLPCLIYRRVPYEPNKPPSPDSSAYIYLSFSASFCWPGCD